jgi:hypothetical protein
MTTDVREEYALRLTQRQAAAAGHERIFRTIGNWRLLTGVVGALIAWYNFWLLPIPVAVFIALLLWHERVARQLAFEKRAADFYQQALRRLDGHWAGNGESGARFQDAHHPYAGDLDVFGNGSMFQLINGARTSAGEEALANWLKAPAPLEDVRLRQQAVLEMRGMLDLREDLALIGEEVRAGLHPAALLDWGNQPAENVRPVHRWTALGITAGLLIALSGYMLNFWPLWPLMAVILVELGFISVMRQRTGRILGAMELPGRDLGILAQLIGRLESQKFESELPRSIAARIRTQGLPASVQISRLRRLIEFRDQAHHQMFAIAAEPLLWSMHFAFAIERWRQISGPHLGEWLAAMGEMEALSSLAGYTAEHPDDVFPEITADGPVFDAEAIAHPLLPASAVSNDLRLDRDRRLLLISGSNMSGKSTLLRSVGLNAVLAWAGAPVRARRLRISPLKVGASMRVQDSLMEGESRFYAEIRRLRQMVDLASGPVPLLFLLDELLSGTNSHDRLIGSEAVVRNLVRQGSIGLVTTHDLALAQIAEELGSQAANVHFEDHIEDGRIAFDYKMRRGVVQKSNAIELMRSVGLEI